MGPPRTWRSGVAYDRAAAPRRTILNGIRRALGVAAVTLSTPRSRSVAGTSRTWVPMPVFVVVQITLRVSPRPRKGRSRGGPEAVRGLVPTRAVTPAEAALAW